MKLRTCISALLSILILVSNIGMALNVHYCQGNVSKVSLTYKIAESCNEHHEQEAKTCCGKPQKTHKKCCKNDLVKLNSSKPDNIIVKSLQLDLGAFCTVEEWTPDTLYNTEAPLAKKDTPCFYCDSNAPPLFKLYCQYIFYA